MSKLTEEEERIWIRNQIDQGHVPGGAMDLTGGRTITRIDRGLAAPGRIASEKQWSWSKWLHRWVSTRTVR